MARSNSKTADEVQIRQLIDCWASAIRDKNIDAAVSHYARDILLYDLAPPLVHRGVNM
jgi:ketosteroid isomerase-like protein